MKALPSLISSSGIKLSISPFRHAFRARFVAPILLALLTAGGTANAQQGRSILDLQTGRDQTTSKLAHRPGESVNLIDLNPNINVWYILEHRRRDGSTESFHLENAYPETQWLELNENGELLLVTDSSVRECSLWPAGLEPLLTAADKTRRPFVELCDGRLFLRNPTEGRRTRREWAADLLRDRVKYGDRITNFIKEKFFRDRYRQIGQRKSQGEGEVTGADLHHRPRKIQTKTSAGGHTISAPELNFAVLPEPGGGLMPARWYAVPDYPGVFLCALTPDVVAEDTSWTRRGLISPLEERELAALIYLVAFDLALFDVRYALGTDHPRVDWSERIPDASRDNRIPGPDGFDEVTPLIRTGKVNPLEVTRVGATFAGGFKRTHGAFKWGELSVNNHGTHYGFLENGVLFSSLHPGLATFIVSADGSIDLKTWTDSETGSLRHIRFARQNGVAILEPDSATGLARPGRLVRDWAKGNWSGSESKQLRTLRAGVCIQKTEDTQFLIYGYFSAATPSTIARVFAACGTDYAMHLDMNAPEHTYLAIYRVEDSQFIVQRLVKEMAEVDPPVDGVELPRYIGYADNRDFFYLLRKTPTELSP